MTRKAPVTRYVVVVDGKPGAFGMWVPDMPGCTSMGNTMADLLTNAQEALQLWAEDAIDRGDALPKPRSIEVVRKDRDVARDLADGGALAIVPLVMETGRPVKANLSLDAGLLAAIDDAAAARGVTRSAFLLSAAAKRFALKGRPRGPGTMSFAEKLSYYLAEKLGDGKAAHSPREKAPACQEENKRALVPARAHSYAGHGRDAAGNNVWTVPAASAAPGSESGAPPLFQRGGPMNSLPGSRYTQKKTTTIYSHVSQPSCRDKRNPRRSDAFQRRRGHGGALASLFLHRLWGHVRRQIWIGRDRIG